MFCVFNGRNQLHLINFSAGTPSNFTVSASIKNEII